MDIHQGDVSALPRKELPEKYIRTFEGDLLTVQKGGTPNLAPLKKASPLPEERLIAASPILEMPPEGSATHSLGAVPAAPLPVSPEQSTEGRAAPIKTYSDDFRERMRSANASTATVLAAEQDAPSRPVQTVSAERPQSHPWPIVAGVLLLIVGGVGVYVTYLRYVTALTPVVVTTTAEKTPVFVDSRETVTGSGTTLIQAIKQSVDTPLTLNTVRLLSLENTAFGTSVFAALGVRAPGALIRNMNAAESMSGIVRTSSGQSPFFILSVGSYSITFSNMLFWEPVMQEDLNTLYPLYATPVRASATATPLTASSTGPVATKQKGSFKDEVVSNHDVRVYRDSDGRSVLLYGYWNQTTLVIARDPSAFTEILARLATSGTP